MSKWTVGNDLEVPVVLARVLSERAKKTELFVERAAWANPGVADAGSLQCPTTGSLRVREKIAKAPTPSRSRFGWVRQRLEQAQWDYHGQCAILRPSAGGGR